MTSQLEKIAWNAARTTGNPVYPHGGSSFFLMPVGLVKIKGSQIVRVLVFPVNA